MSLDWKTVVFELINFAALMVLLWRFLFRPVRKVMEDRRAEIERSRDEAAAARAAADAASRDFAEHRRALTAAADAELAAARARGEQAAAAAIEAARAEASRLQAASTAELAATERRVLADLRPRVVALAAEAADRILREVDGRGLALAFARRAAEALRGRLPAGAAIRAWHSPDVDGPAVVAALRDVLGPTAIVEPRRDDALVAGVRLVAGGLEIDGSASASLAAWRLAPDAAEEARA